MTKRQIIDEILDLNQSADPGFLARFDDEELSDYLAHLRIAAAPRQQGWYRPDHTPNLDTPAGPDAIFSSTQTTKSQSDSAGGQYIADRHSPDQSAAGPSLLTSDRPFRPHEQGLSRPL